MSTAVLAKTKSPLERMRKTGQAGVGHCPASAGRLRFDIVDIVRQHRAELETEHWLSASERGVLTAMERCRIAVLGGHLEVCRSCGHEQPAYNSLSQSLARAELERLGAPAPTSPPPRPTWQQLLHDHRT